jgi:hypothetical protein
MYQTVNKITHQKTKNPSISQEKKIKNHESLQGVCVWLIRGVSQPKQNWENRGSRYVGVLVTNLTTAEKSMNRRSHPLQFAPLHKLNLDHQGSR